MSLLAMPKTGAIIVIPIMLATGMFILFKKIGIGTSTYRITKNAVATGTDIMAGTPLPNITLLEATMITFEAAKTIETIETSVISKDTNSPMTVIQEANEIKTGETMITTGTNMTIILAKESGTKTIARTDLAFH